MGERPSFPEIPVSNNRNRDSGRKYSAKTSLHALAGAAIVWGSFHGATEVARIVEGDFGKNIRDENGQIVPFGSAAFIDGWAIGSTIGGLGVAALALGASRNLERKKYDKLETDL